MSGVILSFYQCAFQFCAILICTVAKALREGRAHKADHASFYISQAILFSVPMIDNYTCWQHSDTAGRRIEAKSIMKRSFSSGSAKPSFSFLWQPKVPSDDKEGHSLKLSGFEYIFTSALFLWTVEAVKMRGLPICDCNEISITWCLYDVCSFHWAFALGILV